MSRGRFVYRPIDKGWIAIRDMASALTEFVDCTEGGAQEAYDRRCRELEADGWTLERRFADSRFINRNGERRTVGIVPDDPRKHCGTGEGSYGMTKKTW